MEEVKGRRVYTGFFLKVAYQGRHGERIESEYEMYKKHPEAVVEYWNLHQGGREKICNGFWQIFNIHDEQEKEGTTTKKQFLVEWLGSPDREWQDEEDVKDQAPDTLREWRDKQKTPRKTPQKKTPQKAQRKADVEEVKKERDEDLDEEGDEYMGEEGDEDIREEVERKVKREE